MQLSYTSEQTMLSDQARRYLGDHYGFDQRRGYQAGGGHDSAVWNSFAGFGWLAFTFSEENGGLGLGAISVQALSEEFGRSLVLEPFLEVAIEAAALIENAAGRGLCRELAAPIIAGERIVLPAHSEAGARYHAHHVETTAVVVGDKVRLSGVKSQIAHAQSADAFIVSARESGGPRDPEGISLFIVPADCMTIAGPEAQLIDGTIAFDVVFEDVNLPVSARLGQAGRGATALEYARQHAISAMLGMAVGSMHELITMTADYLKTREQFDQPLSEFQALRHKLADMVIWTARARSAALMAANALEETGNPAQGHRIASAKAECARAGRRVGQMAIQLHGGVGTTEELEVGHHFRSLEAMGLRFGDCDHHLATLARELGTTNVAWGS
ncbi:MAG: acyl-CoA dehydrogenase family protein [Roseovarius sp.]|nr:acyl-CoA dehydrogenase family protein [Roseovarius sp.]